MKERKNLALRQIKHLPLLLLLCLLPQPAHAHVGSKDVFEQVTAGPYKLLVTIRMPNVIPAVATVEVRSTGASITALRITPLPITGEASKHPPTADAMQPSAADPAFYTGAIWMMAAGSWEVRFDIDGSAGPRTAAVPVPAVAIATLRMQRGLGILLGLLGLFLVLTMSGIVAAAIREARLAPGTAADVTHRRLARIALAASLVLMAVIVYGGAKWWNLEAGNYAQGIYHPLVTHATLSGNQLDLHLLPYDVPENVSSRQNRSRSNNDLLPDHGHLMHLYAIRQPQMDAVFHLHPALAAPGEFRMALPAMPPGHYTLYGDIVHANGFPETVVASIDVPANMPAASRGPDDASASPAPLSSGMLGTSYKLPDGYTLVWDRPATLTAGTAYIFHFRLLDPSGKPAANMQPYMGMAGHAAFIKTDGTVFAHTHPEGSAAMSAVMLANAGNETSMPGMDMPADPISSDVGFPYGFPTPGRYRILIQMKHDNTIETAAFDATIQ